MPENALHLPEQDMHENSGSGTPVSDKVVQAFFQACLKGQGLAWSAMEGRTAYAQHDDDDDDDDMMMAIVLVRALPTILRSIKY